ncbi:retinoblastoma-binding protein 5 [Elysia marginata]|uniref:Retinoblastoma-binding protein 5 n=1 Tax=Elysia marginata TaxID=1093978 RepID=A0AAV4FDU8_9GAST|nr:retinoblastoma-binding protein 5 [Elysia marginata]
MTVKGDHKSIPLDDDSDLSIIASFDRRGRYIYTGNAKGRILAFHVDSLEQAASFRVTTGGLNTTAIKSIEFARRGECFLVNSADRIIRVYESREVLTCGKDGEPEPMQKLQDLILHGTKGELLLDVVWHPVRPIIASISSGLVSIWAQNQVENWSAFAPDFKELDENVEYDERESEFDLEDEDKEKEESKAPVEEFGEVDVDTVEPIQAFVSSDEDEEDENALLFLPVSPEVEDPEDVWPADTVRPTPAVTRVPLAKAVKVKFNCEEQGNAQTADKKKGDATSTAAGEKRTRQTHDPADKKRGHADATTPAGKKKKVKMVDVELPNAPPDEIHPLLNVKKPQEKTYSKRTKPQKSKGSKPEKSRHKDRGSRGGEEANENSSELIDRKRKLFKLVNVQSALYGISDCRVPIAEVATGAVQSTGTACERRSPTLSLYCSNLPQLATTNSNHSGRSRDFSGAKSRARTRDLLLCRRAPYH